MTVLCGRANATYETGGVSKTILSNGVTILVHPEPEARFAAVEVFIRVGARDEDAENSGIGSLLAGSMLAGTKTQSNVKLSRLVSEVGGNFHALWQWNYIEVYAITVPSMCEDTISLLADSIQNSKLDPAGIEYAKTSLARQSQSMDDDPFTAAYSVLRRMIHQGTPYDRTFIGDPTKIQNITRSQLNDFYTRNVTADRIIVSIVGDIDPQRVARKVEICFGNMERSRQMYPPDTHPKLVNSSKRDATISRQTSTAYVMVGYPAPGVDDRDYSAACVANVLLGANKSSLLFTEMREKRGIGYQVGSLYPPLRDRSHIAAYLSMDVDKATPEMVATVKGAMIQQVDALRTGSFTDDDLARAKGYLLGHHALDHERTRDRAFNLGLNEVMGLGYQYDFTYANKVKAVTREDVLRVCAQYLTDPYTVVFSDK